jgi:hypothetical protein
MGIGLDGSLGDAKDYPCSAGCENCPDLSFFLSLGKRHIPGWSYMCCVFLHLPSVSKRELDD